jgi:16S rRNA G1207 methylase RsmC
MPYTTELTEDYMGIVHAGSGLVTGREVIEACQVSTQLMQNTENFHYELIDFSDTTELKITPEDFDQIVEQDQFAALFRPDAVVVIVAPKEDIHRKVDEWEKRVEHIGWKTHISRSRSSALTWLRDNYPTQPERHEHESEQESTAS